MPEHDPVRRRLALKLVYYGPALSGKTTNLVRLHDLLAPERRGQMMTLETANDRTLFFDLLPLGFTAPSGLNIRLKLFTVPGQVTLDSTRKAVLSRADGVVFVADSQRGQSLNNSQSFASLEDNAQRVGLDLPRMPMVVQFNKRDLPDVMPEEELRARWRDAPWPLTFASALTGEGVLETFRALLERVYAHLDGPYALESAHGVARESFLDAMAGAAP
jgi:hypothetical protein